MASYAYGGLKVLVTADTRALESETSAAATRAGNKAGDELAKGIGSRLGGAASKLGKGVATALGTGVLAVTAFGAESIKAAARVSEMGTALDALAKANGLSKESVDKTVESLTKQGLTMDAAQSITAEFVKSHLSLASATKLTTVAQNASIIAGTSVSNVMTSITKAVETGNVRQLRSAGIIINTKDAYAAEAKALGVKVSALNQAEKQTAIMNAVMQAGSRISGVYAASLNDPARVLRTFPKIVEEISLALGQQLLKGFGPLIVSAGKFALAFQEAVQPGGELAPILTAIGKAATQLVSPFTKIIDLSTKWLEGMNPASINSVVSAIGKFAPVFASIGTALGAFAGGKYLQMLPGIGSMFEGLTGPVGAVVTGLVTLAATSPQARSALGALAGELMAGLQPILKQLVPIIGTLGNAVGQVLGAALQALLPLVPPLIVLLQAALQVLLPLVPLIVWLADELARYAPILVPLVVAWKAYGLATELVTAAIKANVIAQISQKAAAIETAVASAWETTQIVALYVAEYAARAASIAWTAAQWLLNAALDANPIGIAVVAIAAFAAAVYLAWEHSALFRTILEDIGRFIMSVFQPVLTAFSGWWATNGVLVEQLWREMWGVVTAVAQFAWSAVTAMVRAGWAEITAEFRFGAAVVTAIWNVLWPFLRVIFQVAWTVIVGELRLGWIAIETVFQIGAAIVSGIWRIFWAYLSFVATIAFAAIRAYIKIVFDVIIGIFTIALDLLTGHWSKAWFDMRQVAIQVWNAISGFLGTGLRAMAGLWSSIWGSVRDTTSRIFGQIASGIAQAWRGMVQTATTAGGQLISGLKSGVANAMGAIGSWVKTGIVDPIVNAVKHFFGIHSPSTVMAGIGGFLVQGLFKGMVPGISNVGNAVGMVFGGFPGALAAMISKGLIGIAGLPGKALNAIMGLFGSGGAGNLAATAHGYGGHRYVWGGGANAATGFDCSSFVNMLTGMLHLPNPGGLTGPSSQHGPATTGWLDFGTMQRVATNAMQINDLYVSPTHMGVVTGPGTGFAARSTATGTGPQPTSGEAYQILRFPGKGLKLPSWLQGVMGKIGGFFSHLFGGGNGPAGGQGDPGGVARWHNLALQVLNMFGRPDLLPSLMAQMNTESGGNAMAQNNWDSNAAIGQNSRGLMQVIPATFAAFAGPFKSLGIFSPLANLYAATAYALKRYGANLAAVWGHGHGYALGGVISEPVMGIGLHSGSPYSFGERGPEYVTPLGGSMAGVGGGGGRTVINVYPSAGMNERELAAMVSRELQWAAAGGAAV